MGIQIGFDITIEECKRRLDAKQQQIDDLQYEYELIDKDIFHTLKNRVFIKLPKCAIDNSSKYLKMIEEGKIDKRKKCDEKESYVNLTEDL